MAQSHVLPARRPALNMVCLSLLTAMLAACNADAIFSPRPAVDIGTSTASVRPAKPVLAPVVRTAGFATRLVLPGMPDAVMPAEEVQCRQQLRGLDARYRDLPQIGSEDGCGIDWPLELSATGGGTAIKPAATLSCQMALTFSNWTKHELKPAARLRYLSGVRTIHQGSSYSCRRIANSGTLSAHARGNAIDVMAITLKNGREIDVHKPGFFSFREKGFLKNIRADACPYFSTVLGPGYDADHRDHFHFDLMERRSGHRACR